jgi:hypothetical protein
MSYDRISFRNPSIPDKWLTLCPGENLAQEIEQEYTRLCERGNEVVVAAGKNLLIDELFLFQDPADAKEFYEAGYRQWEFFDDGEEEGYGFDHVELYLGGSFVARKELLPPTRRCTSSVINERSIQMSRLRIVVVKLTPCK